MVTNYALWLVIVSCVTGVGIGLMVLLRNVYDRVYQAFFGFAICTSLWITSNYFSNDPQLEPYLSLLNHVVLFTGGLTIATLLLFVLKLIRQMTIFQKILLYGMFASSILATTPLVFDGIYWQDSVIALSFRPLAAIYFVFLIGTTYASFWFIYRAIRQSTGAEKLRLIIVALGIGLAFGSIMITNAILPSAFGYYQASPLGPVSTLFMTLAFSYAIVKHRLFDVRLVVARLLGYVLTVLVLGAAYALTVITVSRQFIGDNQNTTDFVVGSIAVVVFGFSFGPVKRFFDRITSKLFYQDGYVFQDVLNKLSQSLISSLQTARIARSSAEILTDALKPSSLHLITIKAGEPDAIISTRSRIALPPRDVYRALLRRAVPIVDIDTLGPTKLYDWMLDQRVVLALPLQAQKTYVALLFVGVKQNGSLYTRQDRALLAICAKQIAIALDNANHYYELSHFAERLQVEVSNATAELRQKNNELHELSTAKDEFVSMASHQLRPQLAAAQGFVDLLKMKPEPDSKERNELLELIEDGVSRMGRLVSDMLNAGTIQQGRLRLNKQRTDISAMVTREIARSKRKAKVANVQIKLTKPRSAIHASVDEVKIREVIMNFLDNAIQYSRPATDIDVRVSLEDGSLVLTVTDHGIGVPRAARPKLFGRFYRAENARAVRPSGTGIGLYVARRVVEAHGGTIIFKSSENRGSTFGLKIPLA